MRILLHPQLRLRDADLPQQIDAAPPRLPLARPEMQLDGLDELLLDGLQRIQAGQGGPGRSSRSACRGACAFRPVPGRRCGAPARWTSPAVISPGGSRRPMIALPTVDLPAPDSPTTPEHVPRLHRQRHAVHRDQRPAAARELHPEVPYVEKGHRNRRSRSRIRTRTRIPTRNGPRLRPVPGPGPAPRSRGSPHRSFGLRTSRSQSPRRFTASTSTTRASPGKMVIHHSPENRKSFPTRMRVPSEGVVGGTPTPRKLRVALGDDRDGEMDGGDHQHGSGDVGEDVPDEDGAPGGCR